MSGGSQVGLSWLSLLRQARSAGGSRLGALFSRAYSLFLVFGQPRESAVSPAFVQAVSRSNLLCQNSSTHELTAGESRVLALRPTFLALLGCS